MRLCVIPARGGSKRIPRKNILPFCGKPMIAYSIEAALESDCFDRIIVSTDDREIADVAESYGAEVPFLRPPELSDDFAGTLPVVAHAIRESERIYLSDAADQFFSEVCCLYATAPMVRAIFLKEALQLIQERQADYCFSSGKYPFPVQRAFRRTSDGFVEMLSPENYYTRSQDLEEVLHDAGQFYWGTRQAFIDKKPIFSEKSYPYLLPRACVQDIDTQDDWDYAEQIYNLLIPE